MWLAKNIELPGSLEKAAYKHVCVLFSEGGDDLQISTYVVQHGWSPLRLEALQFS